MGSSNSKSFDPDTAAKTPVAAGHRRSYSRNVFQSSCVRPASGSPDSSDIDEDDIDDEQISHHRARQNDTESHSAKESTSKLKVKADRGRNGKVKLPDERACVSSDMQLGEWGESNLSETVSHNGCSSSRNLSSRILSRFSFFPGNISSRLGRATSLRFSRAESSTSSTISNDEELQSSRDDDRNRTPQGCEFFPSCFMPRSPGHMDENLSSDGSEICSIQELAGDTSTNREDINRNPCSPRAASGVYGVETRYVDRRNEAREPIERNVQFSRTLSVGRLRDRVLRRSAPGLSCPLQPGEELADNDEGHEGGSHVSNENAMMPISSSNYSTSITSSSLYGGHDFDVDTTRLREARYHDLLEHRSNFLERRRRIRSQVRALQRMGSRFENLSGHERSCILSGQHRTGHCACRNNNRDPNDGANARASISRIVLLAEALFEVLDEIHQQSVVLSSRPSLSSIGSLPAPDEVVEALPLKLYRKSLKQLNEEDAQCYICLVEYEDGDEVRVLPCHHEFHKSCIDKWLKEIHRICPLCRGDVCKSD